MNAFGVGAAEAGLVLLIALILIGPQNFPSVMRQAGHWYRIARRYSTEVMKDVRSAVDEIESEVKRETGDLVSPRELSEMQSDLRQVKSETTEAARIIRGPDGKPRVIPRKRTETPPATAAPAATDAASPIPAPSGATTPAALDSERDEAVS